MWKEIDIRPALASLAANRLRTALTIAIIAIGITALVGIETAIDVLSSELSGSFRKMGTETVSVSGLQEDGKKPLARSDLMAFHSLWSGTRISLQAEVASMAEASAGEKHTDPVVRIIASDATRIEAGHLELLHGRNFTIREQWKGTDLCIIGSSVSERLFGKSSPVGCRIKAGGIPLIVCGVLKKQGALFGDNFDDTIIITYGSLSGKHIPGNENLRIDLLAENGTIAQVADDARNLMRRIRRIPAEADDDFRISSGDSVAQRLSSIKRKLSSAAFIIGAITLLGASVGLMNILMVSVKERREEIGLRKAVGGKKSSIRKMFITESILIGQAGGLIGIVTGIAAGNAVALIMDGGFSIPWVWIMRAIVICIAVSVLSGSVPAAKAAELNPVDALRGQ